MFRLLRYGLAGRGQILEVQLNRLLRVRDALVERLALGDAARQRRHRHREAALRIRVDDDRVRPHRSAHYSRPRNSSGVKPAWSMMESNVFGFRIRPG